MDRSEATKYVFNRIQKLEPENVSKIIGYLLLQDDGDQEMIRLAHGPDNVIFSFINKAKMELLKSAKIPVSAPISPSMSSEHISNLALEFLPFSPASSSHPLSSPSNYRASTSYWEQQASVIDQQLIRNMNFVPHGYSDSISDDYHFSGLDDQLDPINTMGPELSSNYYYPEPTLGSLSGRTSRRSPSLPELKSCHYFNKGYCKHGNNCRYFHGSLSENFSQMFNQIGSELAREEHIFSPGSLEKLELELTELLRSRRGVPVSIASLPMMYYEKYGRTLQAEGYLTESQRHGKAGYSLTKLLARLKNSIRLIDRPHGQHSVVLAEDAPNYMDYRSEKSDPGGIVAGSRQIYLTFPAESTFSEEDVSNYFENFGAVQDVRIPCQQKRMFGFVTFVHPETVKIILTKGNPHFVCGARVLVKPYREKSRVVVDRKYSEKIDTPMYYPSHVLEMDHELHSMPRVCESSRLLRKQFMEEQHALEIERRRLAELHLATKPLTHQPPYYFMDDLKLSEACADHNQYSYTDDFRYLFDVFNNGSTSDDKTRNSSSNDSDPETSHGINLPESPFASSMGTGISTIT